MKKLFSILFITLSSFCFSQNIGAIYYPATEKVIPVSYSFVEKVICINKDSIYITIYRMSSDDGYQYPYIETILYHFKSTKTVVAASKLIYEDSSIRLNEESFSYSNKNLSTYHTKEVPYSLSFCFKDNSFKYIKLLTMYLGYSKDGLKQYLAINIKK